MDQKTIKALRTITDAGHNIPRGKSQPVERILADEWISRGWAEEKPEKAADKK